MAASRGVSIVLATLVVLSLLSPTALADRHNPDGVNPCEGAPILEEYVDREDARDTHERSIDCVVYRSIAVGVTDEQGATLYHPRREVTRAQMATFIAQALDAGGYTDRLSDGRGNDEFVDIEDSVHRRNINRLARAKIVRGMRPNRYEPHLSVTRQQMASFIVQAAQFALGERVRHDGRERFRDVSDDNFHKRNIEAGADTEPPLFRGIRSTRFEPGQRVYRDQMATFLVNLLNYVFDPEKAPKPVEVTLNEISIRGGKRLTGEILGDNVTSATVTGDCIQGGTVADTDGRLGIQFSIMTQVDADAGACGLTFFVTQTIDGQDQIKRRSVAVMVQERPPRQQTAAPELVSAQFVRETTNAGSSRDTGDEFQQTTVRYVFDEQVTEATQAESFHLVAFDGRRFDGRSATREAAADSVLVVFGNEDRPVGAEEFAETTAATIDSSAVADADGLGNPEGDTPVNAVSFSAGVTDAPDVVGVGNFRPGPLTSVASTYVDVTFDQNAFVVDADGFELVLVDNTEIVCTAVADSNGNYQGEDSTTITVACPIARNAGQQIPPADVARAVVYSGTVADRAQDGAAGADGTTNPLQASNEPDVSSTAPDVTSVTLDDRGTATFTFDQPVRFVGGDAAVTAALFRLYDEEGGELAGTGVEAQDPENPDDTVVVTFGARARDVAVGGSVEQGAVTSINRNPQENQEDESAVTNPAAYDAGSTRGPDLIDLERAVTNQTTDPLTGEVTENEITFTFFFDEEVDTPGARYFLHDAQNSRTRLTGCSASGADTNTTEDDGYVRCVVGRRGSGADVDGDGVDDPTQGFAAARAAVLGTVDDGAARDREGDQNHEAARPVIDV